MAGIGYCTDEQQYIHQQIEAENEQQQYEYEQQQTKSDEPE